jgi:hypothetical protein
MADWQDRLASHRMHVDQQFAERVRDSELSRQQWNLVMTAVEFRIEDADEPEAATLVADTSRVPAVLSEVEEVSRGHPGRPESGSDDSLLDRLVSALGGDGGSDAASEAERLATAYAGQLEASLRQRGTWEDVRSAAARQQG